ncbi:MAG: hypothetical protein JNL52_06995 [Flavobacteriales bacterium]|nr:hypothetical protein [Flavobacteriales bacterium]
MPIIGPNLRNLIGVCCLFVQGGLFASSMQDSLHYKLGSEATVSERLEAMLKLAERELAKDPGAALIHYQRAVRYAESTGNMAAEYRALMEIATVQDQMGLYAEHLQSVLRSLELAEAMGSANALSDNLRQLALAYQHNGRTDKAVEEARKAVAMELPGKDTRRIVANEHVLMAALMANGQLDEALRTGRQVLDRMATISRSREEMVTNLLMARILLAKRQPNDALPLLVKAERGSVGVATENDLFDLLLARTSILLAMGRTAEAAEACARASEQLSKANTWQNRMDLRECRYQVAMAGHKWEEALGHLQQLRHWTDSLQQAQVAAKLASMQGLFDLNSKEQDNAELRELNAQQQESLVKQQFRSNLVLVLAGALLLLSVALFLISRHTLRTMRRLKLKNEVVNRQRSEIEAKNLELQQQNMRLTRSLIGEEEKELVIKEIHHRVKNNLQVVDSLLGMQAGQHTDKNVKRLFDEARGRIRSMAQVHEHIYRTLGTDVGPLKAYLEKLSRTILASYGAHDRISVNVKADAIDLSSETLMPLSLVVNELMTNSIKYAFGNDRSGQITIVLRPAGNGHELLFSDDGSGIEERQTLNGSSFGLELVRVLAQQLNGELHILKGSGTTFSLTFAPELKQLRSAS